jgi:hypothetical protein
MTDLRLLPIGLNVSLLTFSFCPTRDDSKIAQIEP